jgi:eukaryotic-like serine/threonine-protein kinase
LRRFWSGGVFVFVEESAEAVAATGCCDVPECEIPRGHPVWRYGTVIPMDDRDLDMPTHGAVSAIAGRAIRPRILSGRYRLVEQIGVGGMARVWRAHDDILDRTVAVKLLTPEHTADPEAFARARNEARCAARIAHPNVAGVYDFGTTRRGRQGAAYLVMELVRGPLLSDYLREGPLHPAYAVRVCAEVSAGLAAAHGQGIVHRDIKPANIILTPTGAKILDFGIATRIGDNDHPIDGVVLGTPAYLAPERLGEHRVAPAADMYALGVLLYAALTGHLPWSEPSDEDLIRAHLSTPARPLPTIDGLPPDAAATCRACLGKRPATRPTAMAAAVILAASVDAQVYLPPLPALDHPVA